MVHDRNMPTNPDSGMASRDRESQADLLLRVELESNPEALCLVRAMVERATEVLQFPESESRAVVRSVDEALTNVIRHAYKGRAGHTIEVTCRRLRHVDNGASVVGIEIVLEDAGEPFEPEKLQGRSLDELRPGGLGLHFIRQSMDKVEFRREKGKNQLRLVKYLAPVAPVKSPQGE